MVFKGTLESLSKDYKTNKYIAIFSVEGKVAESLQKVMGKLLEIEANLFSERRTRNANALLWKCLSIIGDELGCDKWDVYLAMLKRYGQSETITIRKDAYDKLKMQWREVEIIGEFIDMYEVRCFYGSHTYTVKEFSVLINGVMSEMQEMGIHLPMTEEEVERSLALWEKSHQ